MDKSIKLENSNYKNLSILYLDSDSHRAESLEAMSELDPELFRINIFSVSNLSEAKSIMKKRSPELAIFRSNLKEADFVGICVELKSCMKDVELIPVVSSPSPTQIREIFSIGGIADFISEEMMVSYDDFKDVIKNYMRFSESKRFSNAYLEEFRKLSIALTARNPSHSQVKAISKDIFERAICLYDLSLKEKYIVRAAERIYFPDIPIEIYNELLSEDATDVLELLQQLSVKEGKPSDVKSFLISFSYFSAALILAGADLVVLSEVFLNPPPEIKHKSLRVVSSSDIFNEFFERSTENMKAG